MGVVPTQCQKILRLRTSNGDVQEFLRIYQTPVKKRTETDDDNFRPLMNKTLHAIIEAADAVCTTTTKCWDKGSMRRFTKSADYCLIDEAGSAVNSEVAIPWRCKKRLIMTGDPKQLPPACL